MEYNLLINGGCRGLGVGRENGCQVSFRQDE